jgi:hypothetical protein
MLPYARQLGRAFIAGPKHGACNELSSALSTPFKMLSGDKKQVLQPCCRRID